MYELTDIGRKLVPICDALHEWGTCHDVILSYDPAREIMTEFMQMPLSKMPADLG